MWCKRFGNLTVLKYERDYFKKSNYIRNGKKFQTNNRLMYYKCQCDCGNEVLIKRKDLISNNTKSCGCLKKKYKNLLNLPFKEGFFYIKKEDYFKIFNDVNNFYRQILIDLKNMGILKDI